MLLIYRDCDDLSDEIASSLSDIRHLGVVHNCQHLPISTESTNLGGGRGAEVS